MRCNVVGCVAEGDVDCFVVGRHGVGVVLLMCGALGYFVCCEYSCEVNDE